jgi:hypothetical protein
LEFITGKLEFPKVMMINNPSFISYKIFKINLKDSLVDDPYANEYDEDEFVVLNYKGVTEVTSVDFIQRGGATVTETSIALTSIDLDTTNSTVAFLNNSIPNGRRSVKVVYNHGYTTVDPQDIVLILHIPGDKGQLKPYIGRFEKYAVGKANYVSEAGLLVSINQKGYVNPSLNYLENYLEVNEGCGVEPTEETKEVKGVTYTKLNKAVDVYVQQYVPFGTSFNPVFPIEGTNLQKVDFTNWKGERSEAVAVQFGEIIYVLTGFKG